MPELKQTIWPSRYTSLVNEAATYGDNNICGPLALAALLGTQYKTAFRLLTSVGREIGEPTSSAQILEILTMLGAKVYRFENAELYAQDGLAQAIISRYPKPHNKARFLTTYQSQRFPAVWAKVPNCLLTSRQHISAFVDGNLYDFAINHKLHIRELWIVQGPKDECRFGGEFSQFADISRKGNVDA